jgi:hypothetical protein
MGILLRALCLSACIMHIRSHSLLQLLLHVSTCYRQQWQKCPQSSAAMLCMQADQWLQAQIDWTRLTSLKSTGPHTVHIPRKYSCTTSTPSKGQLQCRQATTMMAQSVLAGSTHLTPNPYSRNSTAG